MENGNKSFGTKAAEKWVYSVSLYSKINLFTVSASGYSTGASLVVAANLHKGHQLSLMLLST